MSAPTPSLREQGVQALHEGNLDKAIDLLARAVMADDKDAEAKALLGITYSQKGLHTQAKRALQTAVELHPQNPNYRFNLGVVLERAGDMAGAAAAYRDTLAINKDHAQARAKLQAIPNAHQLLANAPPSSVSGAAAPSPGAGAPPPPGAGAPPAYGPPPGYSSPPQPGGFGQAPPPPPGPSSPPPTPSGMGPSPGPLPMGPPPGPPVGGPPVGGPPPGITPLGPPPGAIPMGAPPIPSGPPPGAAMAGGLNAPQGPSGTVACGRCGQFSRPGLTCEWCSAPMAPPPARPAPGAVMGGPGVPAGPAPYSYSSAPAGADMTASEAFLRRLGAGILDGVILTVISYAVMFVMILVFAGGAVAMSGGGRGGASNVSDALATGMMLMVYGVVLLIQVLYYGILYATKGQTIGKMALGIRLETADGSNPGFFRAVFREFIGKFISMIVCMVGFLWMLWDGEQQCWHDKLFGTHTRRV